MILKKWRVEAGDWCGGRVWDFWLRRSAVNHIRTISHLPGFLFIDLKNRRTGERERFKDNPGKRPPPVYEFDAVAGRIGSNYE